MKQKLKKMLTVILLAIFMVSTINIVYKPNTVYAETEDDNSFWGVIEDATGIGDGFGGFVDGVVGILLMPYKFGILIIGAVVQVITGAITALGGEPIWSVDGILFNEETSITSIDFFNLGGGSSTSNDIRENVAVWYYAMRNISIVILLGILLYVGIRMALSTVSEQEAKYKKMLVNWTTSIALVYVLHYIMIFTIEINKSLVALIKVASGSEEILVGTRTVDTAMAKIAYEAIATVRLTQGFGAAIVYTILAGVTLIFLFMYIKRMLTVGFLIIIAPLITITYSIDKMGDGKSQALNAWLKEFVFNILIQPFHCVIYVVFTKIAINLLTIDQSIGNSVLAIVMIIFMFTAEKMVKKIFNFQASSMADAISSTAFMGTALNMLKKGKKNAPVNPDKIGKMDKKGKFQNTKPSTATTNTAKNSEKEMGAPQARTEKSNVGTPQSRTASGNQQINSTPVQSKKADTRTKGQKIWDGVKKHGAPILQNMSPKNYFKNFAGRTFKGATILGMTALGMATGDVKGGLAGYAAGKSVAENITSRRNANVADRLVRSNQESFAGAYSNYQQKYKDKNDFQLKQDTAKYLKMSDEEASATLTADQYDYYSEVQKMKATFDAVGEQDSNKAVLDTLSLIRNGEIEADFEGTEGWLGEPPEELEPQIPLQEEPNQPTLNDGTQADENLDDETQADENPDGGKSKGGNQKGGNQKGGNQKGGNQKGGNQKGGNQNGGKPNGGKPNGGNPNGGNPKGGTQTNANPKGGTQTNANQKGGKPNGSNQKGGNQKGGNQKSGKSKSGKSNGGKSKGGKK